MKQLTVYVSAALLSCCTPSILSSAVAAEALAVSERPATDLQRPKICLVLSGGGALGAEWRTDVQLGRTSGLYTEFYQPLSAQDTFLSRHTRKSSGARRT